MARTVAGMKRKGRSSSSSRKKSRTTSLSNVGALSESRFVRTLWSANWSFSTASSAGFWKVFSPQLSALQDWSQLSNVYELYKVHKVKITLIPRYGEVNAPAVDTGTLTAQNNQFYLTTTIDRFRTFAPSGAYGSSSYQAMLEYGGETVKVRPFIKPITITYKPSIQNSVSFGNQITPCPWISTASGDTPLIGCNAFMHDTNFSAVNLAGFSCDILVTYDFSMKGSG